MTIAVWSLLALTIHKGFSGIVFHLAAKEVHFSVLTATLIAEITKMCLSFCILMRSGLPDLNAESTRSGTVEDMESDGVKPIHIVYRACEVARSLSKVAFRIDSSFLRLALAACLYVLQNILFLQASALLEPALMQALWQLRLLATVAFSRIVLKRTFSKEQLYALTILVIATTLINDGLKADPYRSQKNSKNAQELIIATKRRTTGTLAALSACFISGVAGVIVEKVLKENNTNLWVSSFRMSALSIIPAALLVGSEYLQKSYTDPAFSVLEGFDKAWPWANVAVQSVAGVLVAMVTKYTSTIAKSFSGGFSILLALLLTSFLDIRQDPLPKIEKILEIVTGTVLLLASSWLYSRQQSKKAKFCELRGDLEEVKVMNEKSDACT